MILQQRLQKKIGQCKQLVIQSLQKTVQQKIFLSYLAQTNMDKKVRFFVNNYDGIVKLTFNSHNEAVKFYDQRSFIDAVMIRKLNIYLDLSASQQQIKRYFLRGVSQENIRSVFEQCRKYGFIRLNILYLPNAKMKDTCILCYLRAYPLNDDQFKDLLFKLRNLQVTLKTYKEKSNVSRFLNEEPKSFIKYQEKQVQVYKKVEKQIEVLKQPFTLTIITIHDQDQRIVKNSNKQLMDPLQKNLQKTFKNIWIDRIAIPTVDLKKKRMIICREIEFKQNVDAQEAFDKLSSLYKGNKSSVIFYLYQPQNVSVLLVFNPEPFGIKVKEEKCIIFEKTEDKAKIIKMFEINYKEIDDCIFQKNKVKISLYKCSQIEMFGLPISQDDRQYFQNK